MIKDTKQQIFNSEDAVKVFQDLLALEDAIDQEKEHFYVMHLDSRRTVKMVECVSIGIIDSALSHPRETFRRAIIEGSVSILVAHNHPSGDVQPSEADIKTTERLHQAGEIIGITLIDHLIFSKEKVYSFRDNREL